MIKNKKPLWLTIVASLALVSPVIYIPTTAYTQGTGTSSRFDRQQLPTHLQNEELDDIEWDPASVYHEEEWYDPSDWIDVDEGIEYEDQWLGWDYTPNIGRNADYDFDEYDYTHEYEVREARPTARRLGEGQVRSRFPNTELDDIEWDPSSGYHEKEWYDPSDWVDADEGVEYEDEWLGYDFTPTVGYDGMYDYDAGEADYDFPEAMYGDELEYDKDYEWDFSDRGFGYDYDNQESIADTPYYEDFNYGEDALGWDFYDGKYEYENIRFEDNERYNYYSSDQQEFNNWYD